MKEVVSLDGGACVADDGLGACPFSESSGGAWDCKCWRGEMGADLETCVDVRGRRTVSGIKCPFGTGPITITVESGDET